MRLEPFHQDQPANPVASDATLDEMLALCAERTPDATALVSKALRHVTTWAELDSAVSGLAATFSSWELGDDAVVGVQLGSSPHGVLTCLALWRAGLVPAMLPLAWRRREIMAALSSVGATALVSFVEAAGARGAETACEIAAALETIRYVGAFGVEPPDGVTPLDGAIDPNAGPFERPDRPDDAPEHVAVVTFDAGGAPVARSHSELVACGVMPFAAARMSGRSALLSTLDLAGLAGLSTGLAPWLTTGCAASFHQPESLEGVTAAAIALKASHVALPGRIAAGLVAEMSAQRAFGDRSPIVTAVWRAPDGRGAAADIAGAELIIDATLFGELGLYAAARSARERHAGLPLGPTGPEGLPPLIDLKVTHDGRFLVRGAACPQAPCPAQPGAPQIAFDPEGYLETGVTGVADRSAKRASLGGKRRGVLQVGGISLALADLDAAYRRSGAGERPATEADPVFGTRLVSRAHERANAALSAAGFGPALAPQQPAETPAVALVQPERQSA